MFFSFYLNCHKFVQQFIVGQHIVTCPVAVHQQCRELVWSFMPDDVHHRQVQIFVNEILWDFLVRFDLQKHLVTTLLTIMMAVLQLGT